MGANMARRLLAAGFSVTVNDASASAVEELVAAGAQGAATPAEVGDATETVVLSLPTPDVSCARGQSDDRARGYAVTVCAGLRCGV
jgi:3-hydroxyisobutyrate dehydrogenase-like beta-hydroxyacid dehydrogenase